jgi:hypothetical protein
MDAVADPPGDVIVNPVEPEATENASPPPLKATVCGDPLALSVIVSVPMREPAAIGVKVTEIVQLVPVAKLGPHVLVSAKSPDAVMDVMVRAAVLELDSVTVCAALVVPSIWEAKVRLVGESITPGAVTIATVPVPFKAAVCGEPLALSVMVRVPVRAPVAVGVKVTEMEQVPPIARVEPQVWVCAKSPEAAIEVILSAAVPELVSVTFCIALVVFIV